MAITLEQVETRLHADAGYAAGFQKAFGRPPDTPALQQALASYVRTIVSGNSPYDRFVAGESEALAPAQRRGLDVFRGKGNCAVCHPGPNLTDEEFHNTGVGWKNGPAKDQGRAKITGDPADSGAFKTPTLREIASTGPYMHDGTLATLADVIEFYDKGGERNPQLRQQKRIAVDQRQPVRHLGVERRFHRGLVEAHRHRRFFHRDRFGDRTDLHRHVNGNIGARLHQNVLLYETTKPFDLNP